MNESECRQCVEYSHRVHYNTLYWSMRSTDEQELKKPPHETKKNIYGITEPILHFTFLKCQLDNLLWFVAGKPFPYTRIRWTMVFRSDFHEMNAIKFKNTHWNGENLFALAAFMLRFQINDCERLSCVRKLWLWISPLNRRLQTPSFAMFRYAGVYSTEMVDSLTSRNTEANGTWQYQWWQFIAGFVMRLFRMHRTITSLQKENQLIFPLRRQSIVVSFPLRSTWRALPLENKLNRNLRSSKSCHSISFGICPLARDEREIERNRKYWEEEKFISSEVYTCYHEVKRTKH